MVPVYEEDEPNTRRKVQRITSPEKWELKQVNIDSEKKNNLIFLDIVYKVSCASVVIVTLVKRAFFHPSTDRCSRVLKRFRIQILVVSLVQKIVSKFLILRQLFQVEFFSNLLHKMN